MCAGCGYGYSWIGVWKSDSMKNGTWTLLGEARADDGTWPEEVTIHIQFKSIQPKAVQFSAQQFQS